MTGPDRLWLNMNHADQQRPAASFVTKGPLAGPPYTQYVRADVVEQLVAAARSALRFTFADKAKCGWKDHEIAAEWVKEKRQLRAALAEWEKADG